MIIHDVWRLNRAGAREVSKETVVILQAGVVVVMGRECKGVKGKFFDTVQVVERRMY